MKVDNDTRGWIMACISGAACIIGSAVICVDVFIRLVPRWRSFRIEDSNRFLAGSLSLSAGVMLFSALYSLLPSSRGSLIRGGWAPRPAVATMIACFLGGVVGIQVLSKLMHRFLPSHVVDCNHTHKDDEEEQAEYPCTESSLDGNPEDRPLLARDLSFDEHTRPSIRKAQTEIHPRHQANAMTSRGSEKPSIGSKLAQRMSSFILDSKDKCDQAGPCFGYSKPCGNECYQVISQTLKKGSLTPGSTPYSSVTSKATGRLQWQQKRYGTPPVSDSTLASGNGYGALGKSSSSSSSDDSETSDHDPLNHHHHHHMHQSSHSEQTSTHHHHHHVASNAFLSIGLQTSIAIALHKLPEGFITYATNHANPRLGVSIFMALFVHNITEGFALALPLYLALNSRLKAMIWASLLGGASQPAGAGLAALWFKVAQSRDMIPSEGVYGVMYAITAGIMTNVALQLFSESLGLIHHKALCISMVFVGMGILGFSSALTAS